MLIGDGASKAGLAAAGAQKAIALVAAGSEERDNIAVAVAALAANPQLRVVMRSGSDDAIEETRSLFRIGAVVDVNGLTASFVAASLDDKTPFAVIATPEGDTAIDETGATIETWPPHPLRCSCA